MINKNATTLLEVRDLTATVAGVEILKGHQPDGTRRRSARDHGAQRLGQEHLRQGAGRPSRRTRSRAATVLFEGKDLFALAPDERARAGMFLGFQYPVEIPGVTNSAVPAPGLQHGAGPARQG